ncbi:hypothetical protein GW746_01920, partial [Candidatus Saccharibacteria bacterium]|nr:hypothetical protein [Candidatus Saccharibacteria bacterium]
TLEYTTAEDWINTYRYSTGFNNGGNATTGSINVVYRVSAALGNLNSVLAAVQDGDTILLDSDLTVTEQITLNKAVTLDGNGYTIDGAFVKSGNSNNSVVGIQSDNVTVRNLGVTSSADQPWPLQLHGLNIYNSENVTLNTVQAHDLEGSGIVVSQGSIVSASNISTANNGWHGINVDKPGAHLTIYGTSQHSEVAPDIYVDNVTVGQVTDVDGQYATNDDVLQTGDRVYNLKLQTPVLESPLDNGYTNTNNFYFEWADVSGAVSYEFQNSQTDAVNLDGSLTAVHYSSTSTDSQLHSVGAPDGTVRYWQVRAVDALGVKSDWSDVWKMTIDMTAPDATVLTSPSDGAVVHGASVTQSWSTTDTDVGHYIYESYHDEAMEDLRWHQEVSGTSKTATNVGDSAYWWRVKAVDNAGNEGEWSDTWKLTIDSTKPYVEITSPTDELNSTDVEVRVTATDENLRHYWVKITRDGVVVYNNTLISGSVVNELVYTATEDGDYVVTLAARDTVGGGSSTGNRSEDVVKMFTVDATDPVVEIDNVVVSTDKMLSFDVSGTDNLSGSRTVGVNIYNEDNTGAAIIGIGRLAHDIVPGTLSVGPYGVIDIDVSG